MEKKVPGAKALEFKNSDFTWAVSSYLDRRDTFAKKAFIYALTSALILLVFYGYFGRMAISIQAQGKFISEQNVTKVSSLTNFQVEKVLVNEGDLIRKDQVIAYSKFALTSDQVKILEKMIGSQVKSVKTSLVECMGCEILFKKFLNEDIEFLKTGQLALELREMFLSGERYIQAIEGKSQFETNYADITSQIEMVQQKIDKINKTNNRRLLKTEYNELIKEKTSLNAQLNRQKTEKTNQLKELQMNYIKLLNDTLPIVKKFNREQALISPSEGIVYDLKIKSGEIVKAGESALVLLPEKIKLIGELYIENKDIGEVKLDQKVKMNVYALPEREYGALFGKIVAVSADVKTIEQNGKFYVAKIELDKQFLKKNDRIYDFKLGMTFEGQIIKKRQRILYVALQKMLNLKDEMFGN